VIPVGRFFLLLTLLVCVIFSLSSPCSAAAYIVGPEDNSVYIDQRDPDLNKSDKGGLLMASYLDENARIVIHFDLTGWAPDSISQAKLYLYHYRGGGYTGSRTLYIYSLTTGFDETTATWNSPWTTPGGDYDNTISASADAPETLENWVEWNVTDIVKNRWSNISNYGFLIRDPLEDDTGDGPYVRFRSHRYEEETPLELPYLQITTEGTGVEETDEELPLAGYVLGQNFPNPFNSKTVIEFELPVSAPVELAIFNILGQRLKTLLTGTLQAGTHTIFWDGTDQSGNPVSSGIYLYRLSAGDYSQTRELLYLK
jgi:hypothetical protein